jgi:uncharacterized protein
MTFRQFVVKVHSRCNLACNHCYVYEAVDQSWLNQPRSMSPQTVNAIAGSIAGYAMKHHLDQVEVVLHGGEPLLLGVERMRDLLRDFKAIIEPATQLHLAMQTNGVRLDQRWADLFLAEDVRIGISLDGGAAANDRHRLYRNGASSYQQTTRAVELLSSDVYRPIFAGLLCTIDVDNDPVGVFSDLAALRPPRIDLLLPHATWEHPPPQAVPGETRYGDWLCAVFDAWFDAPPVVGIRIFEELLNALLGGASRSEAVGHAAPESLVIETDGSLEQTDALKVAFPGAAATGYNVFEHTLDQLTADPAAFGSASGYEVLSPTCQACPIVHACGGGLYPHRYRPGTGFANPSVYCHDLTKLIVHIDERIQAGLAARTALDVTRQALDFTRTALDFSRTTLDGTRVEAAQQER